MENKILCIDDEERVLKSFNRHLGEKYNLTTCAQPEEALRIVEKEGPFSVVVSDLQMPGMDGISLLKKVEEKTPETVRVMLTGQANLDSAIKAVNEGHVFRFLTKPTQVEVLRKILDEGIELYSLRRLEKEMMAKTVQGSIKILTDILSMTNPKAFGQANRLKRLAGAVARRLEIKNAWEVEIAALLSNVGLVSVPDHVLNKSEQKIELSKKEREILDSHYQVAVDLIRNIPRLESIAGIIQQAADSGPNQSVKKSLAANILVLCRKYMSLRGYNLKPSECLSRLQRQPGTYSEEAFDALRKEVQQTKELSKKSMMIKQLKEGMIFAQDVRGRSGIILISEDQEVTGSLRSRLINYSHTAGIEEPVLVYVPADAEN